MNAVIYTAFFFCTVMAFYWVKTNRFIKWLFPKFIWHLPNEEKTVYLTFDDGPTPEVTAWVLDVLKAHNIKAIFFCIGSNIEKHPAIFKRIIDEGHTVGNHTYNHFNGWKTDNNTYFKNIKETENVIVNDMPQFVSHKLFRPPYGKIKASQAAEVRRQGYKIIMWDVLSADFDQTITPEKCLKNVINNTRRGSVIIFHDSVKASKNLMFALPKAIEYLKKNKFRFAKI